MMFFLGRKSKIIKKFTDLLTDLIVEKKLSLSKALYLINESSVRRKKDGVIQKTAKYLSQSLDAGNSFSQSLKICPFVDFDDSYVSFVGFSEKSGNLERTLSYLKEKCRRIDENFNYLAEAAIYPAFVILLAIAAVIFLFIYCSSITEMKELFNDNISDAFILSFLFLFFFCLLIISYIRKQFNSDKMYEVFKSISFMTEEGEKIPSAIENAINIFGFESKEGKLFLQVMERLEYGEDLRKAFACLGDEIEEAFFFAEASGCRSDVFGKVADWIYEKNEKKRRKCFKLIEPFFIAGTGIFLLIFLMNIAMPLLSGDLLNQL